MKEKNFLLNLWSLHSHLYKSEDDFILRYFTYRGFYERVLSKVKEFESIPQEKYLQIMVRNPIQYISLYDDVETRVSETINIEEFKDNVLNYFDNDQKATINKY
jgi:hypothetical protein